jgi:hypothetical protein
LNIRFLGRGMIGHLTHYCRLFMGKTRGGRNTKIMALTNARGLALKLSLIEGQAYEGNHVVELLGNGPHACGGVAQEQ